MAPAMWLRYTPRHAKSRMLPDTTDLPSTELPEVRLLSAKPQPLWWCLARATHVVDTETSPPLWDVAAATLRRKILLHSCTVRDTQSCGGAHLGGNADLLQVVANRLLRPISVVTGTMRRDFWPAQIAEGNAHIVLYKTPDPGCYTVGLIEAPASSTQLRSASRRASIAAPPGCWAPLQKALQRHAESRIFNHAR